MPDSGRFPQRDTHMKSQLLTILTLSPLLLLAPGCTDEAKEDGSTSTGSATSPRSNVANTSAPDSTDPSPDAPEQQLCAQNCEAFTRCGGDAPQNNDECMKECLERAAVTLAKAPKGCIEKEKAAVDCVLATGRCEDWQAWLAWIEEKLAGPAPLCEAQTRDVHENCWKGLEEGGSE